MEIVLAGVALEYKLIDQRIFVALVTMALFTSMLSGPMMQRLLRPQVSKPASNDEQWTNESARTSLGAPPQAGQLR
jgi:Kef-type K+ transport system membrane component KefB